MDIKKISLVKKNFYLAIFVVVLLFAIGFVIAAYTPTEGAHTILYTNKIEPKDTSGNGNINIMPGTGNVGIGVELPSAKLDVAGEIKSNGRLVCLANGSNCPAVAGGGKWDGTKPGNIYYNDGNVGIGTTTPSEKLEVSGNIRAIGNINASGDIRASGTICDGNGCIDSGNYNLLAASTDWTEEAVFTITSSGITFDTDRTEGSQRVNPVLFNWPSEINEIIFEVKNDGDDYCVGGNGVLNLVGGAGTNARCTDYWYRGTTLTKVNREQGDWIRISINGVKMDTCPDQLGRTPNSGYPGKYGYSGYWGTFCLYSESAGHWSGGITELKVEEADWSGSYSMWEWKIWYK